MQSIVIRGEDNVDKTYVARCLARLEELNAPLKDWYCVEVIDIREDDPEAPLKVCELCDYDGIRYVHVMAHDDYPDEICVGCICAGVMERDIIAAKARDTEARNRTQRKKNYLKKKWADEPDGSWTLRYKGHDLKISVEVFQDIPQYTAWIDGEGWKWRNNAMLTDFIQARNYIFDLMEGGYA